jgi:protein involved in polysaccharide export with SLBB domain/beta-lactamase regulating signal transducer with metallopeptidase domain
MSVLVAVSLMHFLWQGALIGGLAWMALRVVRTPTMRYAVGVGALLLMAAAPVGTMMWIRVVQGPASLVPGTSSSGGQGLLSSHMQVQPPSSAIGPGPATELESQVLGRRSTRDQERGTWNRLSVLPEVSPLTARWLLTAWLVGVGLLSIRLTLGWLTARRLTRRSVRTPSLAVLSNAERLMAALNIKAVVTVLESALVQVPTAMGWLKPVVLLPASAMTGLSMAQIDALVAHELAHIKRHDYLVNLLQSAIETLLFYHPMVWLISRRVREERELCCDDLALAACGNDKLAYVSALADLESLRQAPAPALAANGGSLLARIKRILAPEDARTGRGRSQWLAGLAILSAALVLLTAQVLQGARMPDIVPPQLMEFVAKAPEGAVRAMNAGATPAGEKLDSALGLPLEPTPVSDDPDQQRIVPGHLIRLEVAVPGTGASLSPIAQAATIAGARSDLTKAQSDTARAKSESERLSRVDLSTSAAVIAAAQSVPGFLTDTVVLGYLSEISAQEKDRERRSSQNNFGPSHPVMVAIGADIAATTAQLKQRLLAIVDNAKLNHELARQSEQSFQAAYVALTTATRGATTIDVRDPDLSGSYTVQPDGTILLPHAGVLKAAGLTVRALQDAVRLALRGKGLRVSRVLASIEGRASDASIFVLGAVRSPGAYAWRSGLTLDQAIAMAGGVTAQAAQDRPEVHVSGAAVAVERGGAVPAGATVNVPARKSITVQVQGAVKNPGRFTLAEDQATAHNAISAAGGFQPTAGNSVRVRHGGGDASDSFTRADVSEERVPTLSDGDVIDVPVASKVWVNGYVNAPGGYQWEENLTVARAILKAGGVKSDAVPERVTLTRLNASTKNNESVSLDKDGLNTSVMPDDVILVPKRGTVTVRLQGAVRSGGLITLKDDRANLRDVFSAAGGITPQAGTQIRLQRAGTTQWELFAKQDLVEGKLATVPLREGDIVDVPIAPNFFVNGYVKTPGQFQWEPNLTLERALLKAGGVTADGAGNRIEVRRMNPAKKQHEKIKLDKDKLQTVIQPEDIIYVPRKRM